MKKKVLKIAVAAVLSASVLAGCDVAINNKPVDEIAAEKDEKEAALEETDTSASSDEKAAEETDEAASTDVEEDDAVAEEDLIPGLYRFDYESPYEDQEGVIFTDWVYFMPNHYGMIDTQDYAYFEWNEDGTMKYLDSDTVDKFTYDAGKDSISVYRNGDETYADEYVRLKGNVLTPGTYIGNNVSTDEGTYSAVYYGDEIKGTQDKYSMRVRLYSEDAFDIVDVHNLKVGDALFADNCIIEVKTLEEKDGKILINEEAEGITNFSLVPQDESNCYTAEGWFGTASSELGVYELEVSKDVIYTYNEGGQKVYKGEEAYEKLKESYGSQYTTKVVISGGKITEITTDAE